MAKESLRCEWVKCGKAGCRSCPHGPYWYSYWSEGGKTRKRYHGKGDPRAKGKDKTAPPPKPDPLDDVFFASRINSDLCYQILGMNYGCPWEEVKKRYRALIMEHHPDKGGDEKMAMRINSAFGYLKRFNGK